MGQSRQVRLQSILVEGYKGELLTHNLRGIRYYGYVLVLGLYESKVDSLSARCQPVTVRSMGCMIRGKSREEERGQCSIDSANGLSRLLTAHYDRRSDIVCMPILSCLHLSVFKSVLLYVTQLNGLSSETKEQESNEAPQCG